MASHFEQTQKGLETVLQSAEKGKKLFEDLRKFSFDTTFGVDELASASSQLLNVGVATSELNKDLKMLGDLAQGDKAKFAELTSIFSKVQSMGKATSMQIQQIALRGIPITQTLKEMGVQGTASAKQLSEAFEKLTGEGGKFHDAMGNIIDTIEGKRGFIDDTIKEILVNFGDVSGITEAYKNWLDILYNALASVNDMLANMNENPILKAIVSGVIVTAITTIVGAIIGSLVPALGVVIAKLTAIVSLKTLATGGFLGLLAGGIIAVGSAVISFSKSQEDLNDTISKTNRSLNDQFNKLTAVQKLEKSRELQKFYKEQIEKYTENLNDLYSQRAEMEKEFGENPVGSMDWSILGMGVVNPAFTEIDEQIKTTSHTIEGFYSLLEKEEQSSAFYEGVEQKTNSINGLKNAYEDFYNSIGDKKKLAELESTLAEITAYKDSDNAKIFGTNGEVTILRFTDDQKKEIDRTVEYLKEQMDTVKFKIDADSQLGWQKDLQKAFGFTNKDVSVGGATQSTKGGLDYWEKKTDSLSQKMKQFNDILNEGRSSLAESIDKKIEELNSAYSGIMNSEYYSGNESSLESYTAKLQELKNARQDAYGKDLIANLDKENNELSDIVYHATEYADIVAEIYAYENKISFEDAKKVLELQKENDSLNTQKSLIEQIAQIQADLDDKKYKSLGEYAEAYKQLGSLMIEQGDKEQGRKEHLKGSALGAVDSAINGSDVGTFANSIATTGSPLVAIIDTLLGSLVKVLGGMKGMDSILNVITESLKAFGPILKTVMFVFLFVAKATSALSKVLMEFVDKITFGMFKKIADSWDELAGEQETETERLKALNEQYKSLSQAIEQQEEYYLKRKAGINSDNFIEGMLGATRVNDMILTDKGVFSTSPQDTIMAMKHPESLGGATVVQPIINNYAGDEVEVTSRRNPNGIEEMIINISRKVAGDYAEGTNGWDSAYMAKQMRLNGRSMS